ncbi:MAG: alpha-amylase family glycosyl hydrolase [Ferruginibacter sp.]
MNCYMRKSFFLLSILFWYAVADAQLLSWSPQFPNDNSTITITVDATKGNQGLLGYTGAVYLHFGVITSLSTGPSDWKYSPTVWATTTAPVATSLGGNKWSFMITNPRIYFGVPVGEAILRIAILFRDGAGVKAQRNADGGDMYVPIYPPGGNHIQFTQPFIQPFYNITHETVTATIGQPVPVTAIASTATGTLNLYFNGSKIAGPLSNTSIISGTPLATTAGNQQLVSELITGGISYYDTIKFYIPIQSVIAPLPAGVVEGINYAANCSSVTLVLYAPNKGNALVIGDFPGSNWTDQPQYRMNKTPDGNYYWVTVNGLTPGTEYSYEYLVDNSIYVADPYAEKILDPVNDQYIPAATYPGLKPYPVNPNVSAAQNGIVGVLQPCAPVYNWQVANFTKPDKRNLITYELLVRDFGDARNYQMLIDTISYFKRLGINAIELMPVNEFSGNESWGYNPTFYCALDKYYGTKNKFKEFIDLCHQNGIAIIMDVVYNQMEAGIAPQGKLYWDVAKNRPAANNPWLNIAPPHPYFPYQYDLNHESTATQYLVERSLEYWLSEYKVDGFRIDAGKGFTQKCTQVNDMCPVIVGSIEDYDASRVANLERYYDYIVPKYPNTYMIMEFLGQQRQEEQEYANHGFILWGNNNPAYNQNTMGYNTDADFSKIVYNSNQEAFTTPSEMGYMESHDEERLMFKNLQFGNSSGGYDVKTLTTALERQAAAAAVFFTVPGPKMLWQFGERGYDITINFGGDRVANKPPHWEYMADPNRLKLFNAYSKLINLRVSNPAVFNSTSFTYDFYDNGGLVKSFQVADPAATGMRVTVIANFDVVPQARTIPFQTTGNWYNYLANGTGTGINGTTGNVFSLGSATQNVTLQPGEYHIYIYQPANIYTFTGNGNWNDASNWSYNTIPPSPLPAGSEIYVNPQSGGECILNVTQVIGPGAKFNVVAGKNFRIPLNLTYQ